MQFELERMDAARDHAGDVAGLRAELDRLRAVHRLVVDLSPVGIVELDARGHCVAVNRAWQQVAGLTAEEAYGAGWLAAVHPDDRGSPTRDGDGSRQREVRYLRPDGTIADVIEHRADVPPAAGRAGGAIAIVVDVTGQRAAEATARQAQENLIGINELVRSLATSTAPRADLCAEFARMANACAVVLLEPRGEDGALCVTATTESALAGVVPEPLEAAHAVACFERAERAIVADTRLLDPFTRSLAASSGARSGIYEPVMQGDGVVGVLMIGWDRPLEQVGWEDLDAVELVAAETAVLIERAELVGRLEELARRDALTGLSNRRAWDEELPRELARHSRSGESLTVALIDLDHFKRFNDTHGHQAGDDLLRDVSHAWSAAIRAGDRLARIGGEEFAIVLASVDPDNGAMIAERLRLLTPDGVTCSIGAAHWDGVESADEIVARADRALYEAKRLGRDRLVVAD